MVITNVRFSQHFRKLYQKAPLNIQKSFTLRLALFIQDNFSPILNNHQLLGKYKNLRSINITGDWRALYSIQIIDSKQSVVFELFGTHSQLYK